MAIEGMNHFTILTDDLERTRAFYRDLLGLSEGYRPPLGFPGAWFYCGEQAVLHVIAGRALPAERRGVLDHMAFSARDLAAVAAKLKAANVQYELRRQADSGVWQMFFFDPNGARVEFDFAAAEPAPAS